MIWIKIHEAGSLRVVAACDESVLGKKFGNTRISSFYKGELRPLEHLFQEEFDILNLVGDEVVGGAVKNKLCSEKAVKIIDGLPHVQVVKI